MPSVIFLTAECGLSTVPPKNRVCPPPAVKRKITPDSSITIATSGLSNPMGLCWSNGALYVAETGANRTIKIENGQISLVVGNGQEDLVDSPASQAAFAFP